MYSPHGVSFASMRVFLVAHTDAPWTRYFATSFVERGWAVKVVSMAPDRLEGIDVEFIGVEPFNKFANKHLFFSRVPRVRRMMREFDPDVVFAPYLSSNGLLAALTRRTPLVVAAVGGDVFNANGRKGLGLWFREATIRHVCKRAALINTVAQNLTDELLRLGVDERKLMQLNFGADVDRFAADPAMPRHPATRLICTRKHEKVYDIASVVRALARLRDAGREFHCTFLGGGSLVPENRRLAEEAGLASRVTFTDHVDHDEVPGILRSADIYISATHSDGTSVSLLEAMASGLLPVVSRIDANTPWVVDEDNGLLFEPGDDAALAACLTRAMDDRELQRRSLERNRPIVEERGSMRRNLDRLARALETAAGRTPGQAASSE